jgi:hypothetical protein
MAFIKVLLTRLHDQAMSGLASSLWQSFGRPLAAIASAILLALLVVQAESWAIRQGPLLPFASCIADFSTDADALPVSILH